MSTSLLYHTQYTRDYNFISWDYAGESVVASIKLKKSAKKCTQCKSLNTSCSFVKTRKINALPIGRKKCYFILYVYRLRCADCNSFVQEPNTLCPSEKKCYTKAVVQEVLELRREMTIKAVAEKLGLHWETVKNIEKENLKKKYKRISLKNVTVIGIDEFHVGKKGYITLVRDLIDGRVLFIGKGKKGSCLDLFGKKLKCAKAKIRAVAVDMAPSFTSWIKANLPDSVIVYDHFHVIKLMNKKLDELRRSTMKEIDDDMREILKNKRYTLLKGKENLKPEAEIDLEAIKNEFEELGIAFLMKEALRAIYATAQNKEEAEVAFDNWIILANVSNVKCLQSMAKTLKDKREGILAYWSENKLTSASMEGFNSKIRFLMKQAYGYRDEEYFHLKIFDLPSLKITESLAA